jgi:hypothetical protein
VAEQATSLNSILWQTGSTGADMSVAEMQTCCLLLQQLQSERRQLTGKVTHALSPFGPNVQEDFQKEEKDCRSGGKCFHPDKS